MSKTQRNFIAAVFAVSFIFLFSVNTPAQAMLSYLFLDVIDSNQKPVADATIKTSPSNSDQQADKKTDEKGSAKFESWNRPPDPSDFRITKTDYYPFELFGLIKGIYNDNAGYGYRNLKVELLKIPRNKDEKKAVGNEQIKRDFFLAVLNGDAPKIRKMLKSGIDPNITTDELRGVPHPKEIPAMLYAAGQRDSAVMNEFLAAKINLRNENSNIRNLLAYYIGTANDRYSSKERPPLSAEFLETLLKAGASLNAADFAGQPLMTVAAKQSNVEIVRKLIERGADVNAKNKYGSTVLMETFDFGSNPNPDAQRIEIINLLLKSGADPNIVTDGYQGECVFPLKTLAQYGQLELVKLLLSYKAKATLKCKNGANALSVLNGGSPVYSELANILTDAGASVNTANDRGISPLMTAVASGNIAVVEKLLGKGAAVNAQDQYGLTPLIFSVVAGERKPDVRIVELLLKSGANPNLTTKSHSDLSGATALAAAVWYQPAYSFEKVQYASEDILKLLIAYKADVNLTVEYKDSPLVAAAKGGRIEALKLLIEAGADVRGAQGKLALEAAKVKRQDATEKSTYEEVIKLLEAAGAQV